SLNGIDKNRRQELKRKRSGHVETNNRLQKVTLVEDKKFEEGLYNALEQQKQPSFQENNIQAEMLNSQEGSNSLQTPTLFEHKHAMLSKTQTSLSSNVASPPSTSSFSYGDCLTSQIFFDHVDNDLSVSLAHSITDETDKICLDGKTEGKDEDKQEEDEEFSRKEKGEYEHLSGESDVNKSELQKLKWDELFNQLGINDVADNNALSNCISYSHVEGDSPSINLYRDMLRLLGKHTHTLFLARLSVSAATYFSSPLKRHNANSSFPFL